MLDLNLIAPINDLGYGIHSRGIIKGIAELGFSNYLLTPIGQVSGSLYPDELQLIKKLAGSQWNRSAPCVKIWHECQMTDLSGSKLIAYPVWETTKLYPKAVHDLKQMDAVFVTSSWAKNVLIDNIGTTVPIYIVNEAGQDFRTEEKYSKYPVFTFSHVGKFESRKATAEIIKTYVTVFQGRREDTRLIVHCFNPFDKNFTDSIKDVIVRLGLGVLDHQVDSDKIIAAKGNAIVEIPRSRLTPGKLHEIYSRSHIGVYPSKAEGWNLDLFESITNGLPCIASFASAHTEYLDSKYGYPEDLLLVKGSEKQANDGVWFHGDRGNWVEPNLEELATKLDYVFTNYQEIQDKFDPSIIKNRFTWKNSAKQFVGALADIGCFSNTTNIDLEI